MQHGSSGNVPLARIHLSYRLAPIPRGGAADADHVADVDRALAFEPTDRFGAERLQALVTVGKLSGGGTSGMGAW